MVSAIKNKTVLLSGRKHSDRFCVKGHGINIIIVDIYQVLTMDPEGPREVLMFYLKP